MATHVVVTPFPTPCRRELVRARLWSALILHREEGHGPEEAARDGQEDGTIEGTGRQGL